MALAEVIPDQHRLVGLYMTKIKEILTYNKAIGVYTNNVAEYMGVYMGILICIENGIKKVDIYGDSKLVVEQLNGNWKVKNDNIKAIYDKIRMYYILRMHFSKRGHVFDHITFNHVKKKIIKGQMNWLTLRLIV